MHRWAGLQLHHIGYVALEIEPVAQLYIERFNYEPVTDIIADPAQTACVQFLQLNGDRALLEIVAPDGPESVLYTAARRRPGLNHLCYTVGPLEKAITGLQQSGMRLISEPKPGIAFAGRRICWLMADDALPIELVERRDAEDLCLPGIEIHSEPSYASGFAMPTAW